MMYIPNAFSVLVIYLQQLEFNVDKLLDCLNAKLAWNIIYNMIHK